MKPLLIRSAFHLLLKYAGNTVAIRIGVDLVEIVKALVALAEAGKELLQIVPEVDHGDCNAADNDDTADDAQNELQIILHEIDLPY